MQIKKYRSLHQAFVVEGAKSVRELLLSDYHIERLFVTKNFHEKNSSLLKKVAEYELVDEQELSRAGAYESNNAALAIARIKELPPLQPNPQELLLALDDVRDPGNLGTIIRIADWYGIRKIVCSETCTDFYNPKVIAASMGSFTRVQAYYTDLAAFLKGITSTHTIYGASLSGANIHTLELQPKGVVVMGNEANGIRPEVMQHINSSISIPRIGQAESLNVATATAIIMDNFFRHSV